MELGDTAIKVFIILYSDKASVVKQRGGRVGEEQILLMFTQTEVT